MSSARDKKSIGQSDGLPGSDRLGDLLKSIPSAAPQSLPPALQLKIEKERTWAKRLRNMRTRNRVLVFIAVFLLLCALILIKTPRPDLMIYPIARMLIVLGVFFGGIVLSLWVVSRPMYKAPIKDFAKLGMFISVLAFPVIAALVPDAYEIIGQKAPTPESMMPHAHQCLIFGTLTGLPLVLLGFALDRGGAQSAIRASMAGLAGVLVGNVQLQLHCPNPDPLHLLLGHAGVIVPIAVGVSILMFIRRK